jgi:hypothetical protein
VRFSSHRRSGGDRVALASKPWEDVARGCTNSAQTINLGLRPWQVCPCDLTADDLARDHRCGGQAVWALLQRDAALQRQRVAFRSGSRLRSRRVEPRHKNRAKEAGGETFARPRRRGTLSTDKNPSVIRQRVGGTWMTP